MSFPRSRVVMNALSGSTAKWTSARLEKKSSFGSRSVRYCAMAWSAFCPVSGFFNSTDAVGNPLTNNARSTDLPGERLLKWNWRATVRMLP